MTHEDIRQLAVWLRDSQLAGVEITRPGLQLMLKRSLDPTHPVVEAIEPQAPHDIELKAPSLGRLLLSHPQRSEPLVALGSAVVPGQLMALLQIGELLLPVRSPEAGQVDQVLQAHGTTVGYGDVLMQLEPCHED